MDELTAEQLAEWEAYHRLEPIGDERIEFSLAVISSVLSNVAIAALGKPGAKQTNPIDFMPQWDEEARKEKDENEKEPKKQSVEEMERILRAIAAGSKKDRR